MEGKKSRLYLILLHFVSQTVAKALNRVRILEIRGMMELDTAEYKVEPEVGLAKSTI